MEKSIENIEKWQSRELHKEIDRNELAESGLKAVPKETKQHPTVVRRTINEEDLKLAKKGLEIDIEKPKTEQDEDALKMALRGSKVYQEAQGISNPTDYIKEAVSATEQFNKELDGTFDNPISRNANKKASTGFGYIEESIFETEKSAQEFHTGDSSEAITEQVAREFHTTPMSIEEYVEDVCIKYNIDNDIAWKLLKIKKQISAQRHKNINYDELLIFLKSAMNYGDMQIWLYRKQLEGVELTLNDKLKKFFEIKSNENILKIYNVEQNYNENNINNIRKILNDDIEEDEDDMKRYKTPKTLSRKIVVSNDDIED